MAQTRKIRFAFLAGLVLGLAAYHGALFLGGFTPISDAVLDEQQVRIDALTHENQELTDDLFQPRMSGAFEFNLSDAPYGGEVDALSQIVAARRTAQSESKFLMVTFGANWCIDCRTLHHRLTNEPVASYAGDLFHFAYIDVGKLNQNRDAAESLGVSLTRGIPVAVFFGPDGEIIGTTNEGQLEPARYYSSKQILKFIRDIAEHQRILPPDSVD